MRKYLIVLFLFSSILALASPHWSTQRGLNQINMLKPLFDRLEDHDPIGCRSLGIEVMNLARQRNDSMAEAYGCYRMARICRLEVQYDSAGTWIARAEKLLPILSQKQWKTVLWMERGHVYLQQGDLESSLQLFLKSLEWADRHQNRSLSGDALYNIGFVFYSHFNYDTSFVYFGKSLDVARFVGDSLAVARAFNGMGLVAMRKNEYDLARNRFNYAVKLISELGGSKRLLAKLYNNIGVTLEDQGRLQESIEYYNRSLAIKRDLNDLRGVASTIGNMADNYLAAGQLKKSLDYSLEGLKMALATQSKDFEISSYKRLWLTYKELKDFEKSLYYHERFKALDDSISGEKAQKALNEQLNRFEVEKRVKENDILKNEAKERATALSFQRWLTLAAFAGIFLMAILLFWVVRGFQKSRHLSLKLELKKQKLEEANHTLEQVLNENKEMAGIIVHDLRSPLHRTLNLSTMLGREGILNPDQKVLIEKMQTQIKNCIKMINDLLFLEGPDQLQPEWIDLNQDLNKLVESYAQEAVKKDIALQFFPASEEMLLYADSDVLHRIMDNLINNAVKFSPVGKNIMVKLRRQGNDALIYLKDEGPGFSLEDRKGIFKKFARLSAKPTSQESSTGLGLAIVKRMVTQLGGEIRLLDEKEAGAVFEVRIPLEQGLVET